MIVHHRNSYSALPGRGLAFYRGFIMEKLSTTDKPGKTFIWLPFTGGISAFAVILPSPMEALEGNIVKLRNRPTCLAGMSWKPVELPFDGRPGYFSFKEAGTI